MSEQNKDLDTLVETVDATRHRIVANVDALSARLKPENLLAEGQAKAEALAEDALAYARAHPVAVAGGALAAVGAIIAIAAAQRHCARANAPVPLYEAYAMEDPTSMNDQEVKSSQKWARARGEAAGLGARAGEAYYAARSRAARLAGEASTQAAEAADRAKMGAAFVADSTRAKAREAGSWISQQTQTNPGALLMAGAAAGVLFALLLPHGQRANRASGEDAA